MLRVSYVHKKAALKTYLLIICLFVLIASDGMFPLRSFALIGLEEGEKPKEIVLKDLQGNTITVSQYFGNKPLVLLFWELPLSDSFLNYSLDELKFLNEFYMKHHEKDGLEIFAVYTPVEDKAIPDAEIREVRSLISTNRINIPVLIDEGFKAFKDYGVIALPTAILVAKKGTIEHIHPSFPQSARDAVANHIKMLVGAPVAEQKDKSAQQKEADSQMQISYRYALQMYKKGLLEQAFSALNKSMTSGNNYSWAHNLKGIILWKQGNATAAAEAFKHAMALDNNIAARINYAILLSEDGQYKESEDLVKAASYTRVDLKIRAHYILGLAYKHMKRTDLAIRELEIAESLFDVWTFESEDSHFYTFYYHIPLLRDLSILYSESGDKTKAMERLQKAVNVALGYDGSSATSNLNPRRGFMVYE
ncbi:MAG: hypothetical protein C4538_11855 [Nitrospiraceae bacterium]|nr:MAG: hypothetical protein C4538_11855 [Nitrospiraceae bacterium]